LNSGLKIDRREAFIAACKKERLSTQEIIEAVRKFLKEISLKDKGMCQALNAVKKFRHIALPDADIFAYHDSKCSH